VGKSKSLAQTGPGWFPSVEQGVWKEEEEGVALYYASGMLIKGGLNYPGGRTRRQSPLIKIGKKNRRLAPFGKWGSNRPKKQEGRKIPQR